MTEETITPAPAEEPKGYYSRAGFVKSRSENNQHYLDQFKDDPWWPAIDNCNHNLELHFPGYNIAQIKAKFGGLRYYIDQGNCPDEKWDVQKANEITYRAEAWVDGYEYAKRENNK